jgi:carboxylate-amine ligase
LLPQPAAAVAELLLDHVRDALTDAGDTDAIRELLAAVLARGNGAAFQRETFADSGRLSDVVSRAAAITGR